MNSFANIEWLPEAGLTPNQSFYFLDSFAEKIEILLSQREGHQGEAYLKLSKEKLAEIRSITCTVILVLKCLKQDAQIVENKYQKQHAQIVDKY